MTAANRVVSEPASSKQECKAIVDLLDRLGDKWTIMIVSTLYEGPMRYGEIQRQISGISQRMLTLTLKGLTEDGLLSRTVYPTIPPRVDYELTELGFSLRASLIPLWEWARKNMHAVTISTAACSKNRARR